MVLTTALPGGIFAGPPGGAQLGYRIDAGYSASTGQLLWGPVNRTLTPFTTIVTQAGEGKYADYTQQYMTWTGYDIKTGQKLWTTPPKNSSWGYYDFSGNGAFGYGNFYTWGLGGEYTVLMLQLEPSSGTGHQVMLELTHRMEHGL